jgi:hypothetical protein
MKPLVLHPTAMSQWHAMVNEAEVATMHLLDEDTESYLVFLLMRYMGDPQLLDSVIAIEFLESMNSFGRKQIDMLKGVGDKSLLVCGLFPDLADKRNVSLDYYTHMGQAAYLTVGELQPRHVGALYVQLSEQFMILQRILQVMRLI